MANKKITPPKRSDQLVESNGKPTIRTSFFFENLSRQISPISDLTGTPSNIELRDAINTILIGLREIGALTQ